jgi:hypothetical protein
MTEKIGTIKNPLTIIAIFAGIAEVSGTVVLPFINQDNQHFFIYFLIGFPSFLIITFFGTLNFNNKVLYAPSDYKDESNYIKVFKYDQARQENVEIKVNKAESSNIILKEFSKLNDNLNQRLTILETRLNEVGESTTQEELFMDEEQHLVVNFPNVSKFISKMRSIGINMTNYEASLNPSTISRIEKFQNGKAIWLGKNVPFKIAKKIIVDAKEFYPHLEYIHISGDLNDNDAPYETHNQVFIGGATSSATTDKFHLRPLSDNQFEMIRNCTTKHELFDIIRQTYP